jgi:REP element-mobilizing transposase RayT
LPQRAPQTLRSPSQTVGAIIRGFKSAVSRQMGFSVWQRDMYEHIIRDANDYWRIIKYVENNPTTWETDRFYN